jgi:tryptophan-rich sensory protein
MFIEGEIAVSRVWKRFLFNISKGVVFIIYLLGVLFGGGYISLLFGYPFELGILFGAAVFIFLPMLTFIIRDIYNDAKREIELENQRLMRDLGKED